MQIKKELLITAVDDDGKALEVGSTYAFDVKEGMCLIGKYVGITKRGALSFESIVSGFVVTFNVMPTSIINIKKAVVALEKGEE